MSAESTGLRGAEGESAGGSESAGGAGLRGAESSSDFFHNNSCIILTAGLVRQDDKEFADGSQDILTK